MITKKKILPLFITLLTIVLSSISFAGLSLDEMDKILDKRVVERAERESKPKLVKKNPEKSGLSLNSIDDLLDSDEMDFDFDEEDYEVLDDSVEDVSDKQNFKDTLGSYYEKGKKILNLEDEIDEQVDDETDSQKSFSSSLIQLLRGNIVIVLIIAAFAVLLIVLVYIFFYKIKSFSEQAQASKDLTEKYLYNFQEKLNGTKRTSNNLNAKVTNVNEDIDLSVSLGTEELDKILKTKVNNILHNRDKNVNSSSAKIADTKIKGKPLLAGKLSEVLDSHESEGADKDNESEFLINDLVHGSESVNNEEESNEKDVNIKEKKVDSSDAKLQKTDNINDKTESGLDSADAILNDNDAEDLEMLISDDRESDFLLSDDLDEKPSEKIEEIGLGSDEDDGLGDLLDLDIEDVKSDNVDKSESVKADDDDGEMLLEDFDLDLDSNEKSFNSESGNNSEISESVENGNEGGLEELLLEENPGEIDFNTDDKGFAEEQHDNNEGEADLEGLDDLEDLFAPSSSDDKLENEPKTYSDSADSMLIEEESSELLETDNEELETLSFDEDEKSEMDDDKPLIITEELELIDDSKKNETFEIVEEGDELIVSEKNQELTVEEDSSDDPFEMVVEEDGSNETVETVETVVEGDELIVSEENQELTAEEDNSDNIFEMIVEEDDSNDTVEMVVEEDNIEELVSVVENGQNVDSKEDLFKLSSLEEEGNNKETFQSDEFELIEESDNSNAVTSETVENGGEFIVDEENSELEIEELEVSSVEDEEIIIVEDETATTATTETIESEDIITSLNGEDETVTSIKNSEKVEELNSSDSELIDMVEDEQPIISEESTDDKTETDKDLDGILFNNDTEDGFTLIEGITSQHSPR